MTELTKLSIPRGGDHAHAVLAHVASLAVRVHVARLARLLPEHGEAAAGDPGAGVHTHRAVTAVLVTGALPRVTRVSLSRGLGISYVCVFVILLLIRSSETKCK